MSTKIKGTTILMNDWEEIFLEYSLESINKAIDEAIAIKRNYITIDSLKRDIYFNYIKDKREKTRHIALLETTTKQLPPVELTLEQRRIRDEKIKEIMEKTKPWRKKSFIEYRDGVIKKLQDSEKYFGLQTTSSKLDELMEFKRKEIKTKL